MERYVLPVQPLISPRSLAEPLGKGLRSLLMSKGRNPRIASLSALSKRDFGVSYEEAVDAFVGSMHFDSKSRSFVFGDKCPRNVDSAIRLFEFGCGDIRGTRAFESALESAYGAEFAFSMMGGRSLWH